MRKLKQIIREELEDKICKLIYKLLDKEYTFNMVGNKYGEFIKVKSDQYGSFDLPYPIRNKDEYWDLYYDMEDLVEHKFGLEGEEIMHCIEEYIDSKIGDSIWDESDEYLEEAEEESGEKSGGESKGSETSSTGTEWQSNVTRGPANPINYDSEWKGQRGWEGIKTYNIKRGHANPLT